MRKARDEFVARIEQAHNAGELRALNAVVEELANVLPARISMRQMLAFLRVAQGHASGELVTLARIRASAGIIGQHIAKSYQVLLPPSARDPEALGWIEQIQDEEDRRQRFLRLTKEGQAIIERLITLHQEAR